MILSVDPGINHCGVALWTDEGVLLQAWLARSKIKDKSEERIGERWLDVVRAVGTGAVHTLVVEGQQIYRGGRRGANPNDLLELASVLGALAAHFPRSRVVRYLPRVWTRGADHEVIEKRMKLVLSSAEHGRVERKPPSLAHNVEDAVALGLFHFRRLW